MVKVRVVFLLLNNFDLLGVIFRIRVAIETSIGSFAEPVVSSFKLIWEICVIIFSRRFVDEFFSVGALGSEREVCSGVLIGWLHVLVVAFVAWELGGVGTEFLAWSFAVE